MHPDDDNAITTEEKIWCDLVSLLLLPHISSGRLQGFDDAG